MTKMNTKKLISADRAFIYTVGKNKKEYCRNMKGEVLWDLEQHLI